MRAVNLRKRWALDETVLGTFVTTPSARIAELLSHQGFDTLLIDKQHGLIGLQAVQDMLGGMASGQATPLVRVSWNDPAEIMQCLDAGAAGVVCPMIDQPEEARAFVAACRYPPQGRRSLGPIRARLIDPEAYANPLAFAMIETAGSIRHLEAIADTEGLDGLFVGPADLSLSHGLAGLADFSDPELLALLDRVLQVCRSRGLVPGLFTSRVEEAAAMHARGYRYIILSDDNVMLRESARQLAEGFHQATRP